MDTRNMEYENNSSLSSEEILEEKASRNTFYVNKKGILIGAFVSVLCFIISYVHLEKEAHISLALSILFFVPCAIRLKEDKKISLIIRRVFFAISPLVGFYFVEILNGNKIVEDLTLVQFILNMVWYSMLLFVCYVIIRRKTPAAMVCVFISALIGAANHYVLVLRGTVLFPCDIFSTGTAVNVIGNVNMVPDEQIQYVFLLVLLVLFYHVFWCKEFKKDNINKKMVLSICALCACYVFVFFHTNMLSTIGIYAQQWKTQANGFLLNFTAAAKYSIVKDPEGYTLEEVDDIAENVEDSGDAPVAAASERPENVIVIMNESFTDFTVYDSFESSEDPTPFYHSLKDNTVKGYTYVSIAGGGTANSEFEFLTGNTLTFLPQSTVAYQLYFNENTPSVVDQFNELGYETVAFHPYIASGWNRPLVYEFMGFDQKIFRDDMSQSEILRTYISDSSDYKEIYKVTEETDGPLFMFNVTMQNHAGYTTVWNNIEDPVYAEGKFDNKSYTSQVNQYLSLVRASDNALRELIDYYSALDEKTMIVFFGDHQPPLPNDFYADLYGKELDSRTAEEVMIQYETPFFIWTNYEMPSEENVKISLNYLLLEVLERAGIPFTEYQTFLYDLKEELPIINRVGYKTKEGEYFEYEYTDDLDQKYKDLIEEYEYLQYNNLFDNENMPEDFFEY